MTTTVKVLPHPGDGLKVRVTIYDKGGSTEGRSEFLKKGDPEKTYHVSPGGMTEAVSVDEVPDV